MPTNRRSRNRKFRVRRLALSGSIKTDVSRKFFCKFGSQTTTTARSITTVQIVLANQYVTCTIVVALRYS